MEIRIGKIALLTLGLVWLVGVSCWIVANVSLRETRLSVIAGLLDKLPSGVSNPIFVFLWIALLFGWVIPLTLGVIGLLRRKRQA